MSMNSREKFLAVMNFQKPDQELLWEFGYWTETIKRWQKEGFLKGKDLPTIRKTRSRDVVATEVLGESVVAPAEMGRSFLRDTEIHEYFHFDKGYTTLPVENWMHPSFEVTVLEEDDDDMLIIDEKGIRQKIRKDGGSMPLFLEWPVKNRDDFEKIKERFQPTLGNRVPENWTALKQEFKYRDYPLVLGAYPTGFFGSLRYLLGEVNLMMGFYDDPQLIRDMMNFLTDFWIDIWSEVLSQVEVDCASFWEDMSYNKGSLISPAMFREFMMPCYKRITSFLKGRGVEIIIVDTDGDVKELIPLFIESGVTGLHPFEVQAGMDVVEVRKRYPRLQIGGGLNKNVLAQGKKEIDKELKSKLPFMFQKGGYIAHADHLLPPNIPWENFRHYREKIEQFVLDVARIK